MRKTDLATMSTQPAAKHLSPETVARLKDVTILASLNEDTLHCLDGATEITLPAEQILVRQGETARFFWILLSGSLRLSYAVVNGTEHALYTMEPGGTFGEVPLLANIASTSTIRAGQDSDLLQLDEEQFWQLMTACPEVRKAILGNMAMRLAKMQAPTFQQEKMESL